MEGVKNYPTLYNVEDVLPFEGGYGLLFDIEIFLEIIHDQVQVFWSF